MFHHSHHLYLTAYIAFRPVIPELQRKLLPGVNLLFPPLLTGQSLIRLHLLPDDILSRGKILRVQFSLQYLQIRHVFHKPASRKS